MGIGPKLCFSSPFAVVGSNPNPRKFIILNERRINEYLVLLVEYPDCTNFEGKKLMVYKDVPSSQELIRKNNGELDPHFSESKYSPIARFKPTEESLNYIERMICFTGYDSSVILNTDI